MANDNNAGPLGTCSWHAPSERGHNNFRECDDRCQTVDWRIPSVWLTWPRTTHPRYSSPDLLHATFAMGSRRRVEGSVAAAVT